MDKCYCPILKTTTAELRGLSFLDENAKEGLLPVIELTRSRRSKYNPDGDIKKRLDNLKESWGERPFMLDVTTEEDMQNTQIEDILQGGRDGFSDWVYWVTKARETGLSIIPAIHYDFDYENGVRKEIKALLRVVDTLAFRVGPYDDDLDEMLNNLSEWADLSNIVVLLDAGYQSLSVNPKGNFSSVFLDVASDILKREVPPKAVVGAFSSFPDSVRRKNYGSDAQGAFPIAELVTHRELKEHGVVAGDYGSVHPIRYDMGGGTWIPRIDFIDTNECFHYHRYRREDGGYERAARMVVKDSSYKPFTGDVWGDREIRDAADGEPGGKSPVHWIAVRVNLYMTKMYRSFREGNHVSL
jgi:hypothetical protein